MSLPSLMFRGLFLAHINQTVNMYMKKTLKILKQAFLWFTKVKKATIMNITDF